MTRAGGGSARFRQRKLSTKQSLQILHEDQVEKIDDEQQRNIPKVDTGVEKAEEIEHHLQAAISASQAAAVGGKVAQIYIPTPDTIHSSIQYDRLYPLRFSQPATYIRFSSTVEECSGIQYCMTNEDDLFLRSINRGRSASVQCSEDKFEQVMDFFEQYSSSRQPFAAVDNAPVIGLEEMTGSTEFHEAVDENARPFAKEIYEHWKSKRMKRGHRPFMPHLKVETGQETDDGDPYVCFRRREVRQARKTRGRDAQSIEKLRKLRRELDIAQKLVELIRQREYTKKELLAVERTLFDQRAEVKSTKRKLGIKGDDDDLVNQKPQKRKLTEQSQAQRASSQSNLPPRPPGRPEGLDLILLQDVLAEKAKEINKEIDAKVADRRAQLHGYLDITTRSLSSAPEQWSTPKFRAAVTEYLATPPASPPFERPRTVKSPSRGSSSPTKDYEVMIRYRSPPLGGSGPKPVSFRRRTGRGGRSVIDRRGFQRPETGGVDPMLLDRYKFDQDDDDDDDDDETPTYTVDLFDKWSLEYRASVWAAFRAVYAQHSLQATPSRPPPT